MRYEQLTWTSVKEELHRRWLIVPVGAIEQHGPHLPLGVDSTLAWNISNNVSNQLKPEGIVAPTINYGARSLPNSGGGLAYPGTIYIEGPTLINLYANLFEAFLKTGATKIMIINGHWENEPFLFEAVDLLKQKGAIGDAKIIAFSWWSVISDKFMKDLFGQFAGWHVEHAGQAETALMLYFSAEHVRLENRTDHDGFIPANIYCHPTPIVWEGTDGILGKTKHVDNRQGATLAKEILDRILSLLEEIAE